LRWVPLPARINKNTKFGYDFTRFTFAGPVPVQFDTFSWFCPNNIRLQALSKHPHTLVVPGRGISPRETSR
jgi:hypothetical protein